MIEDMERKGRGVKGMTPNVCLSDQGNCMKIQKLITKRNMLENTIDIYYGHRTWSVDQVNGSSNEVDIVLVCESCYAKYHTLDFLNNKNVFPHSSGD